VFKSVSCLQIKLIHYNHYTHHTHPSIIFRLKYPQKSGPCLRIMKCNENEIYIFHADSAIHPVLRLLWMRFRIRSESLVRTDFASIVTVNEYESLLKHSRVLQNSIAKVPLCALRPGKHLKCRGYSNVMSWHPYYRL
jgi:hypothetical protein